MQDIARKIYVSQFLILFLNSQKDCGKSRVWSTAWQKLIWKVLSKEKEIFTFIILTMSEHLSWLTGGLFKHFFLINFFYVLLIFQTSLWDNWNKNIRHIHFAVKAKLNCRQKENEKKIKIHSGLFFNKPSVPRLQTIA